MTKVRESCFCAFCKNERKVFRKKRMSMQGIFASAVLSSLLSLVFWQRLDPKAMVFFVVGIVVTELAVNFRWRLGMTCPYCGFDPLLYKRSPKQACQKVVEFMDERKKDPMFYLSSNGYDKLAKVRKIQKETMENAETGKLGGKIGLSTAARSGLAGAKSSVQLSSEIEDELLNMPPV